MYFRRLEMKLILKYLVFVGMILLFRTAQAQQFQIVGLVLGVNTSNVVPLVNIMNTSTGKRTIGSRQGIFKLMVSESDSLVFTAIGYDSLLFTAHDIMPDKPEDTIQVYMRPKAYLLRDVTIVFGNSRRDSIARAAAEYLATDPLLNNYDRVLNRNKGGVMSPLTAMWNEYSKAGQDMKRFEEFMNHAELLKQVNTRYNKRTIKRATGLSDEYLDDFIMFCKLDPSVVLNSSDYELILAIRECAKRFRAAKGIEEDSER
jgi:hypothetical protein